MKRIWPIAAVCLLVTGAAQAQQIPVRSGDHPTFSRLTLPLPQGQEWRATRTARGVEVTLPGITRGFGTADVFTRMQKNRVSSIQTKPDGLILEVICDCDATAFISGSLLVIDVADSGTTLAGPPLPIEALSARSEPVPQELRRYQTTSKLPWIGSDSPFIPLPDRARAAAGNTSEATALDHSQLLSDVQDNLAQQVANAASAGLLTSSLTVQNPSPPDVLEPVNPPALVPQELPEVVKSPSLNLRITSSMDLPQGISDRILGATPAGIACPADGFLAVSEWGNDSGFSAQIGPARDALVDARDQLNEGAAENLARLFLFFGFGAEALDALKLDPAAQAANPELSTLAHIFEHGTAGRPNALAGFTDCESDVALWATLSLRDLPAGVLIDIKAALRAVNKLPKHLRQIAAPMLSEKLLSYGDPDAAATAMRSIERLPNPPMPQAVMAQAALAMDAGEPATELLQDVVDTNTQQSPDALVKLVDAKLAKDEPLSYETATLVEAYAQELRGTEMGNQLRRTQVVALSQSQHFDRAFESLAAIEPSLSPQANTDLLRTVLEHLGKNADDLSFLEHVFERDETAMAALPINTKLMLANRLMDLGFGAQVQKMLAAVPDRPRNLQRQILAARAALHLRQPFQAQAALIGIETPQAELLLAQAKEMAGEYREAFELFSRTDRLAEASQAAWLSDDWRTLTPQGTTGFGAVASLLQAPEPSEDPLVGPLGRADQALLESATARSTLEQLLSEPEIQIEPEL